MSSLGLDMSTDSVASLLYSIVYSFWRFHDKFFLPHAIHAYTHKLIREGAIEDKWGDWTWTSMGPYSSKLSYQLISLKSLGLVREVCVNDICGYLTVSSTNLKPERYYLTTV